jgi:excisionase family DNA binding protein
MYMQELLSVDQLAAQIGLSRAHVWRLCREGKIPHVRISNHSIRFDKREVDAWLGAGKRPATGEGAR